MKNAERAEAVTCPQYLKISLTALLALGVLGWLGYRAMPVFAIRSYDRAHAQVARRMTEAQVLQLMGEPDRVESSADVVFWDDAEAAGVVESDVKREYWYRVNTFFLPISWTVGFDAHGKVISKHRWD